MTTCTVIMARPIHTEAVALPALKERAAAVGITEVPVEQWVEDQVDTLDQRTIP